MIIAGLIAALLLLSLGAWLVRNNHQLTIRSMQLGDLTKMLDQRVAERTGELVQINTVLSKEVMTRKEMEEALRLKLEEVETLNKIMMGREERILELKDEVNALLTELGKAVRYTS